MKKIIAFEFALISLVSLADSWGDLAAWVHTPNENRVISDVVRWAVIDSKGNTSVIRYDNGKVNVDSLAEATKSLKLSVNSIFNTMAYLASDIILMNDDLVLIDKSLQDLDGKLDSAFGNIMKRLKDIELKDNQSGISKTLTREGTSNDRTIYVANNIFNVAAAQADGKSIASNAQDRLQIANYNLFKSIKGAEPFNTGESGGIFWDNPWIRNDGETISIDMDENLRPTKDDGKHGIHLAGWYTPTLSPNLCESGDTIADQLRRGDNTHYVLTQYKNGKHLHYTEVGQLTGGGCALKFHSTTANAGQDIVVGESSVTNTVTFSARNDSNVEVTVGGTSGKNGNVTITIGVYYQ